MSPPIELHAAKTGNCLRVAVALEEAAMPYVVRRVDLGAGAHRQAAHLALNPRGKVPVLVAPGEGKLFVLTQSNAILLWIDAQVPGRLVPAAGAARLDVLERFIFFITDVIALSHAAFRLRLIGIEGAAPTALDDQAVANLSAAESFLAEAPFVAGDAFSLADIAAFTIASAYAERLDWAALPRFSVWYHTVAGRPAVMRGMAAFD